MIHSNVAKQYLYLWLLVLVYLYSIFYSKISLLLLLIEVKKTLNKNQYIRINSFQFLMIVSSYFV